jgi:transcriptional regulator of acetoin/glycerol metabolism
MSGQDVVDRDVDIVLVVLDMVRTTTPEVTPEQISAIEQRVRIQYGGMRARIAKRKTHTTKEQREKAIRDALDLTKSDIPIEDIARENGVSRSSLYKYLKRGTS